MGDAESWTDAGEIKKKKKCVKSTEKVSEMEFSDRIVSGSHAADSIGSHAERKPPRFMAGDSLPREIAPNYLQIYRCVSL